MTNKNNYLEILVFEAILDVNKVVIIKATKGQEKPVWNIYTYSKEKFISLSSRGSEDSVKEYLTGLVGWTILIDTVSSVSV